MISRKKNTLSVLATVALLVNPLASASIVAHAQELSVSGEPIETLPVRERKRPEYDPIGLGAGPYILYPSLKAGFEYDSNIFASPSAQDDVAFVLSPTLVAKSQFSRHALNFEFGADHRTYFDSSSEDRTDFYGRMRSRIDVRSDFMIEAGAGAAYLHEDRSSSGVPGLAAEPPAYKLFDANAVATKMFNRLRLAVGGSVEHYNYDDVDAIGGGKIDQDFRDGEIYRAVADATYQISPDYSLFLRGDANWRRFEDTPTTNRDSNGYRILGGVEFAFSALLSGRAGAGYMWQNYDNALLQDIDGFSYFLGLQWMPTALITVNLAGERSIAETTVAGSSGRVDSTIGLNIDYELLRNVIVSPFARYSLQEFQGVVREDNVIEAGLKVDYLINRHLAASIEYEYENRDSNIANLDFDRHVIGAYMKVQY